MGSLYLSTRVVCVRCEGGRGGRGGCVSFVQVGGVKHRKTRVRYLPMYVAIPRKPLFLIFGGSFEFHKVSFSVRPALNSVGIYTLNRRTFFEISGFTDKRVLVDS